MIRSGDLLRWYGITCELEIVIVRNHLDAKPCMTINNKGRIQKYSNPFGCVVWSAES